MRCAYETDEAEAPWTWMTDPILVVAVWIFSPIVASGRRCLTRQPSSRARVGSFSS